MPKIILVIFFSLFLFTSCKTTDVVGEAWIVPDKLTLSNPQPTVIGDNLCFDEENTIILSNNLLEMKAYHEKLEFLVEKMLEHYTK